MTLEVVEITPAAVTVVEVEVPGVPGAPGDQNVLVLLHGEDVPDDTPDFQVIYRLLEDL